MFRKAFFPKPVDVAIIGKIEEGNRFRKVFRRSRAPQNPEGKRNETAKNNRMGPDNL